MQAGGSGLKVRRHVVLVALAVLFASPAFAVKTFNPRDFGARGDGVTKDTAALQKALDACGAAGGGVVMVEGGSFVSGPLVLHSHTTLQIAANAVLLASEDHDDYPTINELRSTSRQPLLSAHDAEDIMIDGGGVIDGRGQSWWQGARAEHDSGIVGKGYLRPRLIVLSHSKHIRIDHLTLRNAPFWQIVPYYSDDVTLSDLTITADPHSPNTDAIDPFSSSHVLIERVTADVGDDDIAIKSGLIDSPGPDAPSRDIVIRDCTFLHGHGLSIGSEIAGGAQNIQVENIHFDGTDNGIRIKANRDRGGDVSNVRIAHIVMKHVKTTLLISEYYPHVMPPPGDKPVPVGRLTPFFHDIHITDLKSTDSAVAGFVLGLPEAPVKDVVLEDVSIDALHGLTIGNAQVTAKALEIHSADGQPIVKLDGVQLTISK
jgi:polygalacturonase